MDSEHIECKQCKFVLKISSKFCSECGSKVSHEQTAVTSLGPGPSQAGDACASDGSLSSNKRASGELIPPTDPPVKVMKMIDNEDKPKSNDADQAGNKATPVDATKDWKSDSQEQDSSLLTGPTDVTPTKSTDPKDVNDNDSCTNPSNQQEPGTSCQEPEVSKPGDQGDGMKDISNKTTCQADDGSEHQVLETSPDMEISSEDKTSKPSEGANQSTVTQNDQKAETTGVAGPSRVNEVCDRDGSSGAGQAQTTPSASSSKRVFGELELSIVPQVQLVKKKDKDGKVPTSTGCDTAANKPEPTHATSDCKSGSSEQDRSTDPKDVMNDNDSCNNLSNQQDQAADTGPEAGGNDQEVVNTDKREVNAGEKAPKPSKTSSKSAKKGSNDPQKETVSGAAEWDETDVKNGAKPKSKRKNVMQTRSGSNSETVQVIFNVALSKSDFNFEQNADEVHIRFEPKDLGGFNPKNQKWLLDLCRVDGDMLLFTICVPIPKRFSGLPYKYLVKKAKGEEKFIWEYRPEDSFNRKLYKLGEKRGVWYQYDGAMHVESKHSALKKVKTFVKTFFFGDDGRKNLTRTKSAVAMMLPSVVDFCRGDKVTERGEDLFKCIEQVCDCVRPLFYESKTDLNEVFESYIEESVKGLEDPLSTSEEQPAASFASPECRSRRMAAALIMSYFMIHYNCEMKKSISFPLCNALLPQVETTTRSCPDVEMLLKTHFPGEELRKRLSRGLIGCLNQMCTKSFVEPSWLYLLPMHHFLGGEVGMFEKADGSANHKTSGWWGLSQVKNLAEDFKKNNAKYMPLSRYIEVLSPLFEADYLLPRSVLAVTSLHHLPDIYESCKFPVDALLANLWYHVHVIRTGYSTYDFREILNKFIHYLECILRKGEWQDHIALAGSSVIIELAQQLSEEIFSNTRYSITPQWTQEMIFATQALFRCLEIHRCISGNAPSGALGTPIDIMRPLTEKFLRALFPYRFSAYEIEQNLQIFSGLLFVSEKDKGLEEAWAQFVTGSLENFLGKMDFGSLLQAYCDVDSTKIPGRIEATLSSFAFASVEIACQGNFNFNSFLAKIGSFNSSRAGSLLSKIFSKTWPTSRHLGDDRVDVVLKHIIKHPAFKSFVSIFYGKASSRLFDEDSSSKVVEALSLLELTIKMLFDGTVSFAHLKFLLNEKELFVELYKVAETCMGDHLIPEAGVSGVGRSEVLIKMLGWRKQELKEFNHKRHLSNLLFHWSTQLHVPLQMDDVKARVEADVECEKLSSLWKPLTYQPGTPGYNETTRPVISFFPVSQQVFTMMENIDQCHSSVIFNKLWEQRGQKLQDQSESPSEYRPDDVLKWVWESVFTQWQKLANDLKTGNMTFTDVEKYFIDFRERSEHLANELKMISKGQTWVERRQLQIGQYFQLDRCIRGAETIGKFRSQFQLKGDFTALDILLGIAGDKGHPLHSINKEVMQAGHEVEHISQDNTSAIDAFVKCKQVVEWLKENVKESKHLKTLVDLAMATATGHGDMEVQRVACLHAAAMGYAPLIYDLQPQCGLTQLLALCKSVWEVQKSDPHLATKLIDTNANLDWLKQVKESYGSMEVSALAQVEEINKHGIFRVGCFQPNDEKQMLSMGDVLEMTLVHRGDDTKKARTYTFSQLKDLQSKLMLVAGKTKESAQQVENFVEIFDGTCRVADVYLKLHAAGSILFSKWISTFYCDTSRNVNTDVDFGLSDYMLRGHKGAGSVLHHIQQLSTFMEKCLKEWREHILSARDRHYSLNYFTTKQLVFLRRKLATCHTSHPNTDVEYKQMFALLSSIQPDCSDRQLMAARESASRDIELMDTTEEEVAVSDNDEEMDESDLEAIFIHSVIEAGFSEPLARMALAATGADLIDEGILWCMENEDNEETAEDPGDESGEKMLSSSRLQSEESHWKITAGLLQDLYQSKQDGDELSPQLEKLWVGYLKHAHTNMADCISVEHLGCILDHLAALKMLKVDRRFPPSLKAGQPNLILCPSNEVLSTLLSIYMSDLTRPLPSSEEVLMCTMQTTEEEVELFWRRAWNDTTGESYGRIYCLVNADLLSYATGTMVETWVQKTQLYSAPDYRMVVICSRALEERSHVINVLDRYRVSFPKMHSWNETQAYLQSHLVPKEAHECSGVRLVKSLRSGMGKSLCVQRMSETLEVDVIKVSFHEKTVDIDAVVSTLLPEAQLPWQHVGKIIHLDLAHYVEREVDQSFFSLLVLGSLTDSDGRLWRRNPKDLYLLECVPIMLTKQSVQERLEKRPPYVHSVLSLLPAIRCWSPEHSLQLLRDNPAGVTNLLEIYPWEVVDMDIDQLMDDQMFRHDLFQRPFQYLWSYDNHQALRNADITKSKGDHRQCLETLIRHCGLRDPSWSELRHFTSFLNAQLLDCEESIFCADIVAEDLPNFRQFVLKFMSHMSRDFATRSLDISEETADQQLTTARNDMLALQYTMKRRWESSAHPYIFFNPDHHSMTFLGFHVNRQTGDVYDPGTREVFEQGILPAPLQDGLIRNRVPLNENFDAMDRLAKLTKLCCVMGLEYAYDPDPSYELTMDNVKKILAIHMRFRCGIPVVVMGETGCGKTRLVKFMCDLQVPPGSDAQNMMLIKVHGGTTAEDISRKINDAATLARSNCGEFGAGMHTVLFFDEANTTEAVGVIKEVLCDGTINSRALQELTRGGLRLIAACNPYRRHTDAMIQRLEKAGLGYRVRADQTADTLGGVPLRRLVYRVHALPQSLIPLVWDFGQLNPETELLYIQQMVKKACDGEGWRQDVIPVIGRILVESQQYMREQQNEVSFVSLRDVERVLKVMAWFHKQKELFNMMDDDGEEKYHARYRQEDDEEEDDVDVGEEWRVDPLTRSFVLALGVCYHSCLEERSGYRERVGRAFQAPLRLPFGPQTIEDEITRCQEVLLKEVELGPNIARNRALLENVFMMVVCIELRIPLFLVGKPGSSKSLAKTIVADAMQRKQARSKLFQTFKQAHMVSFQCSQLSTPDGIVSTFRQCAKLQQDKNLDEFVSVVVLDEVGLAEDSPLMPLKTLHPLLEDGCIDDEELEDYKKVAFIGISNWALDPAKMNRGIFVQRTAPNTEELVNTAKFICDDPVILPKVKMVIRPLATAYLNIFSEALEKHCDEFFGLRDYYSLIKMVFGFAKKQGRTPTWGELQHAILRNFGGLEEINPVKVFESELTTILDKPNMGQQLSEPDCTAAGLIRASLLGDDLESERRYLLVLTENYTALGILQQELLSQKEAIVIFGSSFPRDQEYTQVCRNIHRIKVCMEAGRTVVLLNLENLYESLYDALNQYYVYLGGERFVDLGLGTQRVKCAVHQEFRLVVVAEKKVVYTQFPTPLINRLEKHLLSASTLLSPQQAKIVQLLREWTKCFVSKRKPMSQKKPPRLRDVFIGYHADTLASVVLQTCSEERINEITADNVELVMRKSKGKLLQTATPESLVRLEESKIEEEEARWLNHVYSKEQPHDSLLHFLTAFLSQKQELFAKVSTHGRLLSEGSTDVLRQTLNELAIDLDHLQKYDTEQQFCKEIRSFMKAREQPSLLLLQCDAGEHNAKLVACAQHHIRDLWQDVTDHNTEEACPHHVVMLVQLPRLTTTSNYLGFQDGTWLTYHIDDLMPSERYMPPVTLLQARPLSAILEASLKARNPEPQSEMEVDEMSEEDMEIPEERGASLDGEVSSQNLREDAGERELESYTNGEEVMDINALLHGCLHEAVAMIRDAEGWLTRKTHRITLLINVLESVSSSGKTEAEQLSAATTKRIVELMKGKEAEHMNPDMAQKWLLNDVASVEAVTNAGTFRRSLVQCLEHKIKPLLAGLLAYLDTNGNLDLLQVEDKWIIDLWLTMFTNTEFTKFTFSDLSKSMKTQSERNEMQVKTASMQPFQAHLPFSWIIKQLIDDLLVQEGEPDVVHILSRSQLASVMRGMEPDQLQIVVINYLHDYVCMVHKHHADHAQQSIQVVVGAIQQQASAIMEQLPGEPIHSLNQVFSHLTSFHQAYRDLQKYLQLMNEAAQLWPQLVDILSSPGHPLNSSNQMVLGIKVALCILEYLVPPKGHLNEAGKRRKWQNRVEEFESIMDSLLEYMEESLPHSTHLLKCRSGWNRVRAVHLFVQHVCGDMADQKLAVTKCMPLWNMLDEDTNFKQVKYLKTVENFLKTCNRSAVQLCFKLKKECPACQNDMLSPVMLPCKHSCCQMCIQEWRDLRQYQCPVCKLPYDEDFHPQTASADQEAHMKYEHYRKQCNAFFMDLVSRLCFAGEHPPDTAVMERLLSFVTTKPRAGNEQALLTKQLSIHDNDSIDRTPVVRSFLMQLLLQFKLDKVLELMDQYFEKTQQVNPGDHHHLVELCVLSTRCLQDYYDGKVTRLSCVSDKVAFTQQLLREAWQYMREHTGRPCIELVQAVAQARCGLSTVATWVHALLNDDDMLRQVGYQDHEYMFELAKHLSELDGVPGLRVYLMRQIVRKYSLDLLKRTSDSPSLKWIMPQILVARAANISPDQFVIYGESYTKLREALASIALGENPERNLGPLLEGQEGSGAVNELHLLLALYREVTKSYEDKQAVPQEKVLGALETFIGEHPSLANKKSSSDLVRNTLGSEGLLRVTSHPTQKPLTDLLVHMYITVTAYKNTPDFLLPLFNMVNNPAALQGCMFPTMPQDDIADIQQALLGNPLGDQKPVLLWCPNKHPYFIGNCGGAVEQANCRECGEVIGGLRYNLAAGNVKADTNDRTQPGHILGQADRRSTQLTPERDLSPVTTIALRMLLHLMMYLGADRNAQALSNLIVPQIAPAGIKTFLQEHLLKDMDLLVEAVGRSQDDALLIMHLLIRRIKTAQIGGNNQAGVLRTKEARRMWETAFSQVFMIPLLQDLNQTLTGANQLVANDSRLGNSPLLRSLYEVEEDDYEYPEDNMALANSLWTFHTPFTLQRVRQLVDESAVQDQQKLQLLKLFIDEVPILETMKHLPNIVNLQKYLCQYYNFKIDSTEAENITVRRFVESIESAGAKHEVKTWLDSFTKTWRVVRPFLKGFVFGEGKLHVEEAWCQDDITDQTSLAMLLPSKRTQGLTSLALTHYLARVHNQFMEDYSRMMKVQLEVSISMEEAGQNQLISFHKEEELQPLILSHCSYSYTSTTSTTSHTDLMGLQKAIIQRYIKNRPRLKTRMIEAVFREDLTDAKFFGQLEANIPQIDLTLRDKEQIQKEFHDLPDLCQALSVIRVTMGYLVALSDTGKTLEDFMTNTLRMKHNLTGKKAGSCSLNQVRELWMALVMAKSRKLALHNENAFPSLVGQEELPEDLKEAVAKMASTAKVVQTDALLDAMFKAIVLDLNVADAEHMLSYGLQDICDEHDEDLLTLHDGLLGKHICAAWQLLVIEQHKALQKMEEK